MRDAWSETYERARTRLLERRNDAGHWRGRLSSSALSTATAVIALERCGCSDDVREGRAWLAEHANEDGGFGDTAASPSNVSTTTLAWAALAGGGDPQTRASAEAWIARAIGGDVTPARLAEALERVYGRDRTFAVPILAACAISGAFGDGDEAWRVVRALPFELAAFPQSWFRFLGLPVVSYALPALIAIGQTVQHARPTRRPIAALARRATRARTLRTLERIQPSSGGFLEATPLTSFVVMSLVAMGEGENEVTLGGLDFLRASKRDDGSWPIDTDLATWVTTLATRALGGEFDSSDEVRSWIAGQQFRERHPYTGAAPGGWAWTDLPGGVPDADDTPGALVALRELGHSDADAARAGLRWLADLQNRDGGIPTFCRGWGKLPFDQSCADLTAHTLVAAAAWKDVATDARIERMSHRGRHFLVRTQASDGSWTPLWFGNQAHPRSENPVYGSSRVLRAAPTSDDPDWRAAMERGAAWLRSEQLEDGGFGGGAGSPATIEETALAVEGLAATEGSREAIERGLDWLVRATDHGRSFPASPIGLYFARLWYDEELYPLVFTTAAFRAAADSSARATVET